MCTHYDVALTALAITWVFTGTELVIFEHAVRARLNALVWYVSVMLQAHKGTIGEGPKNCISERYIRVWVTFTLCHFGKLLLK